MVKVELADRVKQLPPYLFVRLDEMKAAAQARGVDVIDLGIGDPDRPTPEHIVAAGARGEGEPPSALQWAGYGLVCAAPFHLGVNLAMGVGRRQSARFPGTFYTPDEADRWIHAYNSSL